METVLETILGDASVAMDVEVGLGVARVTGVDLVVLMVVVSDLGFTMDSSGICYRILVEMRV